MVASNIFNFHPYLGKISTLTNIFQMGWFNHQLGVLKQPWKCESFRPTLGSPAVNADGTFDFPTARRVVVVGAPQEELGDELNVVVHQKSQLGGGWFKLISIMAY